MMNYVSDQVTPISITFASIIEHTYTYLCVCIYIYIHIQYRVLNTHDYLCHMSNIMHIYIYTYVLTRHLQTRRRVDADAGPRPTQKWSHGRFEGFKWCLKLHQHRDEIINSRDYIGISWR